MFDMFRTPLKHTAAPAEQSYPESSGDTSDILDFMPRFGSAMMASSSGVTRRHRPFNMSLDLTPSRGNESYALSDPPTPTADSDISSDIQETPKTNSDASSNTVILTPTSDTSDASTMSRSAILSWLMASKTIGSIVLFFVIYFVPGIIFNEETPKPGLLRLLATVIEVILYAIGYAIGWTFKCVARGFHEAYHS